MHCIYQSILKKVNGDHKYSRFTDIIDKNFDVLHSGIILYKIDLACVEIVISKPTVNYVDFIARSNKNSVLVYI